MTNVKLFQHQKETVDFLAKTNRAFIASSPGTGKTLCLILDIKAKLAKHPNSKILVLAPKSLLHSVWENEIKHWMPEISTVVATAPTQNRIRKFKEKADVYITNTDALGWLADQPLSFWNDFKMIILDESTSIANHQAKRSKAAIKISNYFIYRRCLSGTPTNYLLTKLWNQYQFLCGRNTNPLGRRFTAFRNQTQIATQTGPQPNMVTWSNKPGYEKIVAYMVKDYTIRYVLEDVVDMPPVLYHTFTFLPNAKVRKAYDDLSKSMRTMLQDGKQVNAVNAASMNTKLLQTLGGSVITDTETGEHSLVDTQRYDLTLDIVEQHEHTIVFYNWKHQRIYFMEQCEKRGLNATFIDGTVKLDDRTDRVNGFQNGQYDVIFCQPQSTSHGLTLTKADCTIWSVPTYLSEYYVQGNNRMIRTGQNKRTTIIHIEAEQTIEKKVYNALRTKLNAMELLQDELL